MRNVIWKYPLPATFVPDKDNRCMVAMPAGARIVHVEILEDGRPVLWVEFSVSHDWDGKTPETRPNYFDRYPTGYPIPERWQHVKTWPQESSVWHLYRFEDADDATGRG